MARPARAQGQWPGSGLLVR